MMAMMSVAGCKTTKKKTEVYNVPDKPIITFQKTACFGKCPVYKLEIYESGAIKLFGEKNLDKVGNYSKTLTKSEINDLKKTFLDSKFFEFNDEYTAKKTDLPTTYISFENEGKYKKIRDYSDAPEDLKKLEKLIENIVSSEGWIKQE